MDHQLEYINSLYKISPNGSLTFLKELILAIKVRFLILTNFCFPIFFMPRFFIRFDNIGYNTKK